MISSIYDAHGSMLYRGPESPLMAAVRIKVARPWLRLDDATLEWDSDHIPKAYSVGEDGAVAIDWSSDCSILASAMAQDLWMHGVRVWCRAEGESVAVGWGSPASSTVRVAPGQDLSLDELAAERNCRARIDLVDASNWIAKASRVRCLFCLRQSAAFDRNDVAAKAAYAEEFKATHRRCVGVAMRALMSAQSTEMAE